MAKNSFLSTAQSPFYNSGQTYGSKHGKNWETTSLVRGSLDQTIPGGVFYAYLSKHGLGGTDRKSQFAQGLYNAAQTGWQAATRANPSLTFRDYLNREFGQKGQGIEDAWLRATPGQRGEQPSLWVQNNRTQGWG